MSCDALNSVLQHQADALGQEVYEKTLLTGPWTALIPGEGFPANPGSDTITYITWEATVPSAAQTWETMTVNTELGDTPSTDGGICVPPATTLSFARTVRQYNLAHTAINSAPICLSDLEFSANRAGQLAAMRRNLMANTKKVWTERIRSEYDRVLEHKIIADSSLTEATTWSATEPTSKLTIGILNRIAGMLRRMMGAEDQKAGMAMGAPVWTLVCSSETLESLLTETDYREDVQYSNESDRLLAPLGATGRIKSFVPVIDDTLPNHTFGGGAWTDVSFYGTAAATYGTKATTNPAAYRAAPYTTSYILLKDVCRVVTKDAAPASMGAGMDFQPINLKGDWRWVNEYDATCNPDKNVGHYRAVFRTGTKPVYPDLGFAIRHRRCALPLNLATCDYS